MAVRACVSIPVHESPAVVLDQVANVRAFMPDAAIVLHVAQSFLRPAQLAPLLPDGVYVNDVSLSTEWGDTSPAHNANFRFADERFDFDVFVMHSSNDLYVRPGAEARLGDADAGVQLIPCHPEHRRSQVPDHGLAAEHDGLRRLAEGGTVFVSQPEGTFFERNLFRRMLVEIERALGSAAHPFVDRDSFWGTEHYVYATIAARLADATVPPLLYSEVHGTFSTRPMSEAVIWAIREGRLAEREWIDLNDPSCPYSIPGLHLGPPVQRYDFDHLYAVKRIPRRYDDPLRHLVRTIARTTGGPPRLPAPVTTRGVTVAAFAEELVADPGLLAKAVAAITPSDPVTVAIGVPSHLADSLIPMLGEVTSALGLEGEHDIDMEALVIEPDELGLCRLGSGADALLSDRPAPCPLDTLVRIGHSNAAELRALVSRLAYAPRIGTTAVVTTRVLTAWPAGTDPTITAPEAI